MPRGVPEIDQQMGEGFTLDPEEIQRQIPLIQQDSERLAPDQLEQFYRNLVDRLEEAFSGNDLVAFQQTASRIVASLVFLQAQSEDEASLDNPFAFLEGFLSASFLIPIRFKEPFLKSIRSQLDRFRQKESIDESNERERLADSLRSMSARELSAMFVAVMKDRRFRSVLETDSDFVRALTEETTRKGKKVNLGQLEVEDIGELHKRFAPLFAKIIANRELRYYLNLAIDDACRKRSDQLLQEIESKESTPDGFYIPALILGFGVYGQVVNNELMHGAPDLAAQSVLTVDANRSIGGQFAVGSRPFFRVNNRVRPERRSSRARPGTEDNIMPVGQHAVVDLPAVSSQTYPSQNLLGSCLKVNGILNSRQFLVDNRVTGFRKTNRPEGSGLYAVDFVNNRTNRRTTIYTDIPLIADGIGEDRFPFTDAFDVETRQIIAESEVGLRQGESVLYYKATDFARLAATEGGDWRKQFQGEGIVIGDGDYGIVTVATQLGYGPDEEGTTQSDFVRRINWMGQQARNSKEWCDSARPRYVDIAREFPRPMEGETIDAKGKSVLEDGDLFQGQPILVDEFKRFLVFKKAFDQFKNKPDIRFFKDTYEPLLRAYNKLSTNFASFAIRNANAAEAFDYYTQDIAPRILEVLEFWQNQEFEKRFKLKESVENKREFLRFLKDAFPSLNEIIKSNSQSFGNTSILSNIFTLRLLDVEPAVLNKLFGQTNVKSLSNPDGKIFFGTVGGNEFSVGDFNEEALFFNPISSLQAEQIKARFEAYIEQEQQFIDENAPKLEKVNSKTASASPVESVSDERQRFSRINPIPFKAVRMVREEVTDSETGEVTPKVRVFWKDDKGQEQSVLGDWVVGCAGVESTTDDLFVNFEARTESNGKVGDTVQPRDLVLNPRSLLLFKTTANPNRFLNGLKVENVESLQQEGNKFYAKLKVDTPTSKEFIFEALGQIQDGNLVQVKIVNANASQEAIRIAQALETWFERPEAGRVDELMLNGVETLPISRNGEPGDLQAVPVTVQGQDILFPVASRLSFKGRPENIFLLGPSNRFPLTDQEREQIPALRDVNANLASMFRYVPATERFVSDVFIPQLRKLRGVQPFSVARTRYQLVRQDVKARAADVIARRKKEQFIPFELDKNFATQEVERLKLPNVADPNVIIAYCIQKALSQLSGVDKKSILNSADGDFLQSKCSFNLQKTSDGAVEFKQSETSDSPLNIHKIVFASLLDDPLFFSALFKLYPALKVSRMIEIDLKKKEVRLVRQS